MARIAVAGRFSLCRETRKLASLAGFFYGGTMTDLSQALQVAKAAAATAGLILREKYETGCSVRSKAPSDLVTEADIAAEEAIVSLIRESYPNHAVLAEESHVADACAEHLWVIDPLDGTTNFVHRVPHVAVSIAYYQSGRPCVGVVFNPLREDMYVAIRGGGATHNGKAAAVSTAQLDESLVGVGFYYDRGTMMQSTLRAVQELFEQQIRGIRRMGSAALDLCQVGTGQFGGFFEYQLSPWDFAAGRLFVEEAGGTVTTCRGADVPLSVTSILATTGTTRETMQDIVGRHLELSGVDRGFN